MIDKMEKLIEEQKEWSAPFLFNTTDSTHGNNGNNGNEESVLVDICSVLRRGVPYTFPNHYSGLDSKNRLIIELRVAAIKAGFNLTTRSSKSKKELDRSKHYGSVITLTCQQGRLHEVKLKKSASSSSSTVPVPKKTRGRPPTNKVKSPGIKYRNKSNPKAKVNPLNKKPQKATTMRPRVEDDLCPFGFTLKMYKLDHSEFPGIWCITPKGKYSGTF